MENSKDVVVIDVDPIYASPEIGNIIDVQLRILTTNYLGSISVDGNSIIID